MAKKFTTCGTCSRHSKPDIRLKTGVYLPYSGGLVDCEKHGTGYYPRQLRQCPDYKSGKKNDS